MANRDIHSLENLHQPTQDGAPEAGEGSRSRAIHSNRGWLLPELHLAVDRAMLLA